MNRFIVLLGPSRSGKTTVAERLSDQLGLGIAPFGALAAQYWEEIGYDPEAERASRKEGWSGFYRYLQPFEAHAIERVLAEMEPCILELDERQGSFADAALRERVQRALEPHDVVLLLPSPDIDKSVRVLEARQSAAVDGVPLDEHFVRHRSNHDLAKQVVYTKNKTPEETCEEIMARLQPSDPTIILIGPMNTGKSTQGKLLAERLERPQASVDRLRWDYYKEIGWSKEEQDRISQAEGFSGVYRYWKRFELHAVERVLQEHGGSVIDFGAGHSVYENPADFARAQEALRPYPNVVLLLPSPDLDESVALLRERSRVTIDGIDLNRFFITHLSKLAKRIVYTEGKTPEETSQEIARGLRTTP